MIDQIIIGQVALTLIGTIAAIGVVAIAMIIIETCKDDRN
jgi:hypothetical protein